MAAGSLDRLKAAWGRLTGSFTPQLDYLAFYRARLVAQSDDLTTVDVQPDRADLLPPLSKIPLRVGIPGSTASVSPGAYVFVGWDGGDPQKAYALPIWDGGATVLKLTFVANRIEIGGGADAHLTRFEDLKAAFDAHVHPTGVGPTGTTTPLPAGVGSSSHLVK